MQSRKAQGVKESTNTIETSKVPANLKFAFAYMRVSTEMQEFDAQKGAIEKFAMDNRYVISQFFQDFGVSGKIPALERPEFGKMLTELETNKTISAVIVYEVSRIGRTFDETRDAFRAIKDKTPLLAASPKESFLNSTDSFIQNIVFSVFSAVAERERELISERTKAGMAAAKAKGVTIGRPIKTINMNQALLLINEGVSKMQVAKRMNVSKMTLYANLAKIKKDM